jgi:polyferredoxin
MNIIGVEKEEERMMVLIIGILILLFTVYSVLPFEWALQWCPYVIDFLQGGIPVLALCIGLVAVLIGIADIRDRIEEKKEKEFPVSNDKVEK